MSEPAGVCIRAMEDHRHQANLAQGVEQGSGAAGSDGFSSPDESKRGDFLRLAVIQDLKVFGLQVVHSMAFLVADDYVQEDFLAR